MERMGCRCGEEDGAEGEERSSHCREEVREEGGGREIENVALFDVRGVGLYLHRHIRLIQSRSTSASFFAFFAFTRRIPDPPTPRELEGLGGYLHICTFYFRMLRWDLVSTGGA